MTRRLLVLCCLAPLSALAAPLLPTPKLDPKIHRAIATGILGAAQREPARPGPVKVLVELTAPATLPDLDALVGAGAQLSYRRGRAVFYDRFVAAVVDDGAAARVAALPSVRRVTLAGARGPMPLDRSAQLVRLPEARAAAGSMGPIDELTGKGILIADNDSAVDPFEPTFFRGDAGYFEWIDLDGDGVFTPGTDAIDLDRDGKLGAGELAQALRAVTVDDFDRTVPARPDGFDPGVDWLFLDTNGNGKRDYGAAAGFDDSAPALGEPLFVPDDVNRNGKLELGERVVRLGTSKFRAISVTLANPTSVTEEYDRGMNLSQAKVDFTAGRAFGFPDALHATGVATILAGDVPLVGRRWVGIAPDADLVVSWDTGNQYPVDGALWELGLSPNVVLYELAPWTGDPLDGSDGLSQVIDTSTTQDHVTHTCPTGDQGSARKHAGATVAAAGTAQLAFDLPAHAKLGNTPLTYVQLSINVRGGTAESLQLVGPSADAHDIAVNMSTGTLPSGAKYYVTRQMSPRQTDFTDVVLYSMGTSTPLPVGTWTLKVGGDPAKAITVDAYLSDDQSSWAVGAAWDAAVASDRATVGIPSVADHCIAVNAQPDHLETADTPYYHFFYELYDVPAGYADKDLAIRAYSPRGPRIDGVMKPDVTAPDNPWVAAQHEPTSTVPYGAYHLFGGTSGASPHVTGVAALLAQMGVQGDDARDAIRKGAAHDATTGQLPNGDYGYGRLDAAGALGVTLSGKDFAVAIAADPVRPSVGDDVKLVVTASGDGDATTGLVAKWDDTYDGSWDTAYAAELARPIKYTMPGRYVYKVRVRNAGGHVAEAVLTLNVDPERGCGCRVGGAAATAPWPALVLIALGALWVRRRRAST